ncbi:MAG: Digeranylgeranylglycerophospholipid reductase [Candidatus Heimdallarchaeota archaeon LC_3]|nr:MAG: Digeranylgeranylglycerophospholipid reductase [Candidatus Heimdallarchaeota archaeon LC_3]
MESFEVIVVGAGPAGTNAATKTAEFGLKTIVLEEHLEVGVPVQCGEGVSQQLLEYHNIEYENNDFVDIHLSKQKFYFAGQKAWDQYTMLSGFSTILLNRTKFDQMFANQAVDKGAEIRTKSKVTNVSINKQGVEVTVKTPEGNAPYSIKGKVIVAADGPAGRIGRSHGIKLPTKYVHAVEYVVKGKHSQTMDFYFDHELTPYGYSWVFPKEEYSKIGLVCRQVFEPAKRLNKLMERMEKKFNTKFEKINLIGGIIPAEEQPPEKTVSNRLIVTGDAAGFTNPYFYSGISIAILTGRFAGETIAKVSQKDSDFSEKSLMLYESKWRKEKPFDKRIYEGRNLFYKKFSNKELEIIGKFADVDKVGQITSIPWFREKLLTLKAFTNKDIRADWKEYKKAIEGMSLSGKWGF